MSRPKKLTFLADMSVKAISPPPSLALTDIMRKNVIFFFVYTNTVYFSYHLKKISPCTKTCIFFWDKGLPSPPLKDISAKNVIFLDGFPKSSSITVPHPLRKAHLNVFSGRTNRARGGGKITFYDLKKCVFIKILIFSIIIRDMNHNVLYNY